MSSKGHSLAVVGMSGSNPVVMDIDALCGTVSKYFTFRSKPDLTETPNTLKSYGAIYYEHDELAINSYFYTALS